MTFPFATFVVAVTGFIALSYEILWFRGLSFATGGSPAMFGLLLGFYLGGLAVGSFGSSILCSQETAPGDPKYLRYVSLFVLLANLVGFSVLPSLAWAATHAGPDSALGLIALASAMLGAVLPLISHFGIAPDRIAGTRLSYLYAGNIVGSVLGSFVTGFILLDLISIPIIALLLLLVGCTAALILLWLSELRLGALLASFGILAVLAGAAAASTPRLFDQFYERLLFGHDFRPTTRFADVVENRSGVITVTRDGTVHGGGAYDGKISTDLANDRNKIVRAYAISALHPKPRRVLVIGLSTGAWAQVIVNHPEVESLTAIEINPGYLRLIAKYPQVSSLLSNPKVRIIVDDGRRWLTRNADQFDMIVSNTTLHWRAHSTNLLSIEYCQLIRAHLRPGGVYYFNTTGSAAALKTAMVAFPFGLRFMNFAAVSGSPLTFNRGTFQNIIRNYRIDDRPVLTQHGPNRPEAIEALIGSLPVEGRPAILARLGSTPLVTDDNMYPEWHPTADE